MYRRIFCPEFVASIRSFWTPAANATKQDLAKWEAQKIKRAIVGGGISMGIALACTNDEEMLFLSMPAGAAVGFASVYFMPLSLMIAPAIGAGAWRARVLERNKKIKRMDERIESLLEERKEMASMLHSLRAEVYQRKTPVK
jgi:hypothetical protein